MDENGKPVLVPELAYRDAQAATEWLTEILGLSNGVIVRKPDGTVAHAEMWWHEGVVYLEQAEPQAPQPGPATICLVVESAEEVDSLYARAVSAGVVVEFELGDTPFGSHQFAVRDPERNVWTVGTYQPSSPLDRA